MKNKILIVGLILVAIFLPFYLYQKSQIASGKTEKLTVDVSSEYGVTFIGTEKDVEGGKRAMGKLVDPADSIVLNARELFRNGKYVEAEREVLKALKLAKHSIVRHLAHHTLLEIYEKTDKYDLAIEEIDILLDYVNEQTKIELLQRKENLQKMFQEQQK
jgi:tetratricopeptide (TPR) repeat protein